MQMKTVTLFRHAKSGQKNDPKIEDFDRTLANRGLKDAPRMGMAMSDYKLRPNLALCSPSARTRQTYALAAAQAWDNPPRLRFDDRLYEAAASSMMTILRELPADVAHVMIVGHNPGLHELALELIQPQQKCTVGFADKFPTAAIASFTFDIDDWKELAPHTGKLRLYTTPKMLGAA
jgi:phosphohistidine phosphatase